MLPSQNQRAQNQQIQRALQYCQSILLISGSHLTQVSAPLGKMSTGEAVLAIRNAYNHGDG
jgi:hypothetical protein